jgi:hypothetical protein
MGKYFPELYGNVECHKCEKENCENRGKYQRNVRHFEVTSGRCPRLPDMRGFVDVGERKNYYDKFFLVSAELTGDDTLYLTLNIPKTGRTYKVYQTKSGYWYYNTFEGEGENKLKIKRIVNIESYSVADDIIEYIKRNYSDYCVFRAEITNWSV